LSWAPQAAISSDLSRWRSDNHRSQIGLLYPYCHPMQLHFCRVAVFCCSCIVPLEMIYRAFVPILWLHYTLPSRR
jgi:hypothetical protein